MGNKRKGQLTTDSEWHKHLRKIGKRFFWKGERKAGKKMIEQDIKINLNNLMTFEELDDLDFENESDNYIVGKLINAELNWRTNHKYVIDYISEIELEVGGVITKDSLKELLNFYSRNIVRSAWEAESIGSLIEIFDYKSDIDLRVIIEKITKKTSLA